VLRGSWSLITSSGIPTPLPRSWRRAAGGACSLSLSLSFSSLSPSLSLSLSLPLSLSLERASEKRERERRESERREAERERKETEREREREREERERENAMPDIELRIHPQIEEIDRTEGFEARKSSGLRDLKQGNHQDCGV
jgi:hypothetical protein